MVTDESRERLLPLWELVLYGNQRSERDGNEPNWKGDDKHCGPFSTENKTAYDDVAI
jgi:hypothetical protein